MAGGRCSRRGTVARTRIGLNYDRYNSTWTRKSSKKKVVGTTIVGIIYHVDTGAGFLWIEEIC
jgi:hypothetical protein